jgi:hypothetical protein
VKRMPAALQFLIGLVLKPVLNRGGVRGGRRVPPGAPSRAPRPATSAEGAAEPSVRRRPLLLVMFGALVVGLALMLIFDHWLTRVVGVLALFTFIVTGVFLIADPAFLDAEEEAA